MTNFLSVIDPAPVAFSISRVAKTVPRPVAASLQEQKRRPHNIRFRLHMAGSQHGVLGNKLQQQDSCRPAIAAVQVHWLAGDNAWREPAELGVLIKEPSHDAGIGAHIWCRDVHLGTDGVLDRLHRSAITGLRHCIAMSSWRQACLFVEHAAPDSIAIAA